MVGKRYEWVMIAGLVFVLGLLYMLSHWQTFRVRSVDAMAWTQDRVMPEVQPNDAFIAEYIRLAKELNVTHMALSVPYDDPPGTEPGTALAYLKRWVGPMREQNIKVWYRMSPTSFKNFYDAGFDYRLQVHRQTIVDFVSQHPELFLPGIFLRRYPNLKRDRLKA
jgi:hypothetical protein